MDPNDEGAESAEKTVVRVSISSESYQDAALRNGFAEEQNDRLSKLMDQSVLYRL
jgi:hypothetical protein